MKLSRGFRIIGLILVVIMSLPMGALADIITSNGVFVDVFESMEAEKRLYAIRIGEQEASYIAGGWYLVNSSSGKVYVRARDVTRVDATEPPAATPVPGAPTPTLRPGATPTPEVVTGVKDDTYTGTVISYTVPTGGLWLYKSMSTSNPVENLKAGSTIKLTQESDSWYSIYYNGSTYYVPVSGMKVEDVPAGSTMSPSAKQNVRSVVIGSGGATLHTGYSTNTFGGSTPGLTGATGNTLTAGSRVNCRYVGEYTSSGTVIYIYSYDLNGKAHYFSSASIAAGSESSASVVSNEDVKLMSWITTIGTEDTNLYVSANTKADYIEVTGGRSYYGVKVDSTWYKVQYGSDVLYLKADQVASNQQFADNSGTDTSSYLVTIGSAGASYYGSMSVGANGVPNGSVVGTLSAGQRVLASQHNSTWYIYMVGETKHYLHYTSLADYTATSSVSGLKIFLEEGMFLYSKPSTSNKTSIKLPQDDYYTVQVYNEQWYSIVYGNATYYIDRNANAFETYEYTKVITVNTPVKLYHITTGADTGLTAIGTFAAKVAVGTYDDVNNWEVSYQGGAYLINKQDLINAGAGEGDLIDTIANTATGKTYTVTIGVAGATLYSDSGCTVVAGQLSAGEVVKAERHTASLYTVTSGTAKLYLPVRFIASVKGGDDLAAENAPEDLGGGIGDVVQGEKNDAFASTVVSYTIPTGGLWLYYQQNVAAGGKILNAGATVSLNTFVGDGGLWYTTWYGGSQYYVLRSSLSVAENNTAAAGNYSIVLDQSVQLYKTTTFTAANLAGITLQADGTRINVSVGMKNTNGTVNYYRYTHYNGTMYYFPAKTSGIDNVNLTSISTALVGSNAAASLITKINLPATPNTKLYSAADKKSTSIEVDPSITPALYGVSHDASWYKVIYQDIAWYMFKTDAASSEQMTISNGAASTTYTVVIAAGGVKLYTLPQTNTTATPTKPIGTDNYFGTDLPGGTTVAASQYNATWYTFAHSSGRILYFQNAGVANSNSGESISSFQIELRTGDKVRLYNNISANAAATVKYTLDGPAVYTLRRINNAWSSVVVSGSTYYVKNMDIPDQVMKESNPVASTSVGGTYMISIGGKAAASMAAIGIPVYRSSLLTGTTIGHLPTGTKISGTLMYVEGAKDAACTLSSGLGMVYAVKLNGVTGYIDATYVSGIVAGDEVNEGKEADQGGSISTPVGTSFMKTLNAGTIIYASMSTSATTLEIGSTMTKELTKVNDSWYSLDVGTSKYFIPVTMIEQGVGSGGSLGVGESVSYTFTEKTVVYNKPEDGAVLADVVMAGTTRTLSKINDKWYELTHDGQQVYVKVTDIMLPTQGGALSGTTGQTTDGTGIITAYVLVNPSSGTVNLRRTAATTATILDRIPKGTQVKNNSYTVDKNNKVWYNVTYNGKTGYVVGDFVEAVGTVSGGTGDSGAGINLSDPGQDIGKSLVVNTGSVNIRSNAGTNYSIVGKVDKGTVIVPLSYATGTDGLVWYKFQFNNTTIGYIRYDFLTGTSVNNSISGNVAIRAGGTNLRSGAGETFGLIARLEKDMIVTITGSGRDSGDQLWYRVTYNNLSGYVRSDLVRQLTAAEDQALMNSIVSQYTQLGHGDKGETVRALQQQLINLGYLAVGGADGIYGTKTTAAVKSFQTAKGLSATGVATPQTQAALFDQISVTAGSTQSLDWFGAGYKLINANKGITVFDIKTGVTWSARYINGANHADVIPASEADATKLKANKITGSYERRPVIVTIAGQKYAGSMYAVGHGTTSYCSYFSGVMCIHFTNSKTHGSDNVDSDHQAAIGEALKYSN